MLSGCERGVMEQVRWSLDIRELGTFFLFCSFSLLAVAPCFLIGGLRGEGNHTWFIKVSFDLGVFFLISKDSGPLLQEHGSFRADIWISTNLSKTVRPAKSSKRRVSSSSLLFCGS